MVLLEDFFDIKVDFVDKNDIVVKKIVVVVVVLVIWFCYGKELEWNEVDLIVVIRELVSRVVDFVKILMDELMVIILKVKLEVIKDVEKLLE